MVNKDLHISQTQTYGSSGSSDSFSLNDGIGPSDAVTMCPSLYVVFKTDEELSDRRVDSPDRRGLFRFSPHQLIRMHCKKLS